MITIAHFWRLLSASLIAATLGSPGFAAVLGTNVPANPLTAERVTGKPEWREYLERSERQRRADQEALRAELQTHGLKQSSEPKSTGARGLPLDKGTNWYGGLEARRIADNVVSFQTPAGGWCKNTDFTSHGRAPGEMFGAQTGSLYLSPTDFDQPQDPRWSYVGTFDNGATITPLRFLAKVICATGNAREGWERPFLRGLDYVFTAQYPNGGWPQVWPLQGGYHDAVTLNDNAMLNVIELLRDVAAGGVDFAFVPAETRIKAEAPWRRGLDCLLAAQVKVAGKPMVWCQQYDALTLAPASARNYEMPALSAGESAKVVLFLMQIPQPDARVVASVHHACAWFEQTRIMGKRFASSGAEGRKLMDSPGAGPIWARYYEIGSNRPIFGDRDLSIHDDVNEVSQERRKGYAWFCDTPKRVLQHYAKWAEKHPVN